MTDNHNLTFRPLVGGIEIRNATITQKGTLGLVVVSSGGARWILSCYHVLCRNGTTMPPGITENIVQPIAGPPDSIVAQVSDQRANRILDCAAAAIDGTNAIAGRIYGIGRLTPPVAPASGMRVLKSGAETGVTEGIIRNPPVGDDVIIEPLRTGHTIAGAGNAGPVIAGPGDSGSIWVDANTMSPVALTCESLAPGNRVLARNIMSVLNALQLQFFLD